jgi:hypothetical protein
VVQDSAKSHPVFRRLGWTGFTLSFAFGNSCGVEPASPSLSDGCLQWEKLGRNPGCTHP